MEINYIKNFERKTKIIYKQGYGGKYGLKIACSATTLYNIHLLSTCMYVCVPCRLKANFIIFPTMFGAVLGFEINNIESVIIRQGRLLNFLIFLTVFSINLFNGYNSSKLLLYAGPKINLQINT